VGEDPAQEELLVSATAAPAQKTRTAPSRKPDGFPLGFYRYRNYTIFAFTAIPMAVSLAFLVSGVRALGAGEDAWKAWLAAQASPGLRTLHLVCLAFTLYFAVRFAWVGRKIAVGRIGPVPSPPLPMPLLGVAPLGGFVTVWLVLLVILGGWL
jgi:fumarate reductase subunit C